MPSTDRFFMTALSASSTSAAASVCMFGKHVAVEVERDANLAVAKALAGDLWMYARGQQVRRVCVPQIVEPDAGQGASAEEADPFLAQAVRPQRQTIGSRCHEVVIR